MAVTTEPYPPTIAVRPAGMTTGSGLLTSWQRGGTHAPKDEGEVGARIDALGGTAIAGRERIQGASDARPTSNTAMTAAGRSLMQSREPASHEEGGDAVSALCQSPVDLPPRTRSAMFSVGSIRPIACGSPGSALADGIEPGLAGAGPGSDHGAARVSQRNAAGWPTHEPFKPSKSAPTHGSRLDAAVGPPFQGEWLRGRGNPERCTASRTRPGANSCIPALPARDEVRGLRLPFVLKAPALKGWPRGPWVTGRGDPRILPIDPRSLRHDLRGQK